MKAVGALGLVALAGVGWAVISDDAPEYSVERVVDGDTIIVGNDAGETGIRVRLLSVDTPEMDGTGELEGCYAHEAKDYLTELLPTGTAVELDTDVEDTDRYGRLLAGVYLAGDDALINAEIARGGYGVAALYQPNEKFYPQVKAAEEQAQQAGAGIHDPELGCSPASFHEDTAAALAALAAVGLASVSDDELDDHRRSLSNIRTDLDKRAQATLRDGQQDGTAVHNHFVRVAYEGDDKTRPMVERLERAADTEHEKRREKAAEEQRLRLEAERRAEERRIEQEQRHAAREAERTTATATPEPAPAPTPAPAPAPAQPRNSPPPQAPAQPPSGGGAPQVDSYTGCRAYGGSYPPNSVDDKGRAYTRIDCTTKTPI